MIVRNNSRLFALILAVALCHVPFALAQLNPPPVRLALQYWQASDYPAYPIYGWENVFVPGHWEDLHENPSDPDEVTGTQWVDDRWESQWVVVSNYPDGQSGSTWTTSNGAFNINEPASGYDLNNFGRGSAIHAYSANQQITIRAWGLAPANNCNSYIAWIFAPNGAIVDSGTWTSGSYWQTSFYATSSGIYRVEIHYYNATSGTNPASAFVNYHIAVGALAPVMTLQPRTQGVIPGSTVTFTSSACGSPAMTFQWRKDGVNITGATSPNLFLSNAQSSANGTYSVVISNSYGSATSNGASLTVTNPPAVTSNAAAIGMVAMGFAYNITATNAPNGYGASGLPPGLSINTATGIISGVPTLAGTFNVTVSAVNAVGAGSLGLTLRIDPLTITDNNSPYVTAFSNVGTSSYIIPPGTKYLFVKAWGAGGGYVPGPGAAGAFATAAFAPSAEETVTVDIGNGGTGGYQNATQVSPGQNGADSVVTFASGRMLLAAGGVGGSIGNGPSTVVGNLREPVIMNATSSTPPNLSDPQYPSSGTPAYGGPTTSMGGGYGWPNWWEYGQNGRMGHVVLMAYSEDTSPPSKPAGLRASNAGSNSFTLSWNPSTDNIWVSDYEVISNGSSLGTVNATSRNIAAPMSGEKYVFNVRARDWIGNWSAWSESFEFRPCAITVEGGTPARATRYPSSVFSVTANPPDGTYFFRWTVRGNGSVDNPGSAIANFTVGEGDASVAASFVSGYQLKSDSNATLDAAGGQSGTVITIRAKPAAPGYIFAGWFIYFGPGMIVDSRQPTTQMVMGPGNSMVYAGYRPTSQAAPPEAVLGAAYAVDPTEAVTVTAVGTCWGNTFNLMQADYSTDSGATWNIGTDQNGRRWTTTSQWISYPYVSQQTVTFTIPAGVLPSENIFFRAYAAGTSGASVAGYCNVLVRGTPTLTSVPTDLIVSNLGLTTDGTGGVRRSFILSWSPPSNMAGVAYYDIQWNGKSWTSDSAAVTSVNGATWDPAAGDSAQQFQVRCRSGTQTVGPWSNPLSVWLASPPKILTQPASQTLSVGQALNLAVLAGGSAPLGYLWSKDGVPIEAATAASYSIGNVQLSAAGAYRVKVSNPYGFADSEGAIMAVNSNSFLPVFTTQPISQTVVPGVTIVLSVTTSALPAASYQWLKNGAAMAGATNASITLANAQPTDSGNYNVIATNSVGSAASDTAIVRVTTGDPNADSDGDGVADGVEIALGLNPYDPNDANVHRFEYDKINQLKRGPGGLYIKDAEGNIKELRP